jgi:hypothetical protein
MQQAGRLEAARPAGMQTLGGKTMRFFDALAMLDYPTSPLLAANQWDMTLDKSRAKLNKAVQMGLLFKMGRHHYSATPELLQLWIEKGVLI